MKQKKFTATSKILISGEHSVVYSQPALVCPVLSKRLAVSLNNEGVDSSSDLYLSHIIKVFNRFFKTGFNSLTINIKSEIPPKSGLGSSAALAYAVIQALVKKIDAKVTKRELVGLVQRAESFVHGKSSGIDPLAVVYKKIVYYQPQKQDGAKQALLSLSKPIKRVLNHFYVINSGQAVESTKQMVKLVQSKLNKKPSLKEILDKMGALTKKIKKEIKSGKVPLDLIKQNHQLLSKIGVVGQTADGVIHQIQDLGGAAKISGAGGLKQGSGMILACHPKPSILTRYLNQNNYNYFKLWTNS